MRKFTDRISVRIDPDLLDRIRIIQLQAEGALKGGHISQGQIIRMVIERGLDCWPIKGGHCERH